MVVRRTEPWFNIKMLSYQIENPIVEIRRSYDRLISTMGFPIRIRCHLYIESGSSSLCCHWCQCLAESRKVSWGSLLLEWATTDLMVDWLKICDFISDSHHQLCTSGSRWWRFYIVKCREGLPNFFTFIPFEYYPRFVYKNAWGINKHQRRHACTSSDWCYAGKHV